MPQILHFDKASTLTPVVESIRRGGLVAFPTDTVYGIGTSIGNENGLERIYRIKGRSFCKPLPVLVASKVDVAGIAQPLPHLFYELAAAFWPGALTLVVKAAPTLSSRITAGGSTVGVRMPDHPVALQLLSECGGCLATTSANRSNEPEARHIQEMMQGIGKQLDWIVDGGPCGNQPPSTVLDLTQSPPRIRRPGPVTEEQIRELTGIVVTS